MPEEPQETVETTTGAGAEITTGDQPITDFETWLASQPEAARKAYDSHLSGLKSALDKERAKTKKRDDDAAEAERKRKEAEMSELQKAQARIAELEKQEADRVTEMNALKVRHAIEAEATAREFHRPADAYQLIDLKALNIGDDGAIGGLKEALDGLVKERPYLVKKAAPAAGDTNATQRGGSDKPVMSEDEKSEIAARLGVRKEYVK